MKKIFCLFLIISVLFCGCSVVKEDMNKFIFEEIEGGLKITGYKGLSEDLVVPESYNGKAILEIGEKAFYEKNFIVTITFMGNCLLKIGKSAFAKEIFLTELTFPKSVTEIGDFAFAACKKLEKISDFENLAKVGEGVFLACTSLKKADLSGTYENLGKSFFSQCFALESVTLSENIKQISDSAFEECEKLSVVENVANLNNIGNYAFSGCFALSDLNCNDLVAQENSFRNSPLNNKFETTKAPEDITIDGVEMKRVFYDDFDENDIDYTKWSKCPEWQRQDGYWDDDDSFVDGKGNLILQVRIGKDKRKTSGAIRTLGKFEHVYGYYETRCKLSDNRGFWSAFWLQPISGMDSDNNDGSSSDGCEVDIFESPFSNFSKVNHAIHWDGYGGNHKNTSSETSKDYLYYGYHTFSLNWTATEYTFFIDGEKVYTTSAAGTCSVPSYVKLTVEIGTWGGWLRPRDLPLNALTVDHVKIYE